MKHVAIYVRVSTNQQSTKSQEPDLERWANGQEEPVKWYEDKFTGKTMDRPGWNKLEEAISKGKVSTVVVWRLDRLGRTADGLTSLFTMLQAKKVNLVSLKDGVDLSTVTGRLIANILASIAEWETEIRGERVRAGQTRARAEGKRWGGSKAGVRKKVTQDQIDGILNARKDKKPIAAIARMFKLSRDTIYDVLQEKV